MPLQGASCCDKNFLIVSRKFDDAPMRLMLDKPIAERLMLSQLEALKAVLQLTPHEYEELVASTSHSRVGSCVVMVQTVRVRTASCHGRNLFVPPCALQRSAASNILRALDDAVPQLRLRQLQTLSQHVKLIVLIFTKDSASSNNLASHAAALRLPRNVLMWSSRCDAHLINRIQQSLLSELGFMGPLHSCGLLLRQRTYGYRFLRSLVLTIASELNWVRAHPGPAWGTFSQMVVKNTVLRHVELVRSALSTGYPQPATASNSTLVTVADDISAAFNGNWLQGEVSHYSVGSCCSSRAEAVRKCAAALLSYAKLMTQAPAMSRWLGPAELSCQWSLLSCLHGLGPRAWRSAFAEAKEADNHEDDGGGMILDRGSVSDEQAFRAETSRRVRQYTAWVCNSSNLTKLFLHSICIQPLDALISFVSGSASCSRELLRPVIFSMTMPGGPTDAALAQLSGLLENKSAVFFV